jgi:hypothetical protein
MVDFNPKAYVLTARQTWEKRKEFLAYIESNKHLALPFHVEGLHSLIPPTYPGETTIILARSHHAKSTVIKDFVHKAQKSIEGRAGYAVALVSHEDVAERTAGQLARRYDSEFEYIDDQFIHIGRSFGMKTEQVADLHMTNILTALNYGLSQFGENMRYSAIFNDYLQIQPPDPFRKEMTSQEQRRLQIADDMKRWTSSAVQFTCPVFCASQALTKQQRSNYTEGMKIPGAADTEESKEIYNYADIVYAYWLPKMDYPMYHQIDDGKWSFQVEPNLAFVRVVKRKYAEELGFQNVVGRVFPLHITEVGDFVYDPEYHEKIYTGSME